MKKNILTILLFSLTIFSGMPINAQRCFLNLFKNISSASQTKALDQNNKYWIWGAASLIGLSATTLLWYKIKKAPKQTRSIEQNLQQSKNKIIEQEQIEENHAQLESRDTPQSQRIAQIGPQYEQFAQQLWQQQPIVTGLQNSNDGQLTLNSPDRLSKNQQKKLKERLRKEKQANKIVRLTAQEEKNKLMKSKKIEQNTNVVKNKKEIF